MPSEGLVRRIERFNRGLVRLKRLRPMASREVVLNDDTIDILENNIRIVIESLMDVGRFIISRMMWEAPSSYSDVADVLFKHDVISMDEMKLLKGLAGLRNVIVHMYADVNHEILVETLNLLETIEALMNKMIRYIRDNNLDP